MLQNFIPSLLNATFYQNAMSYLRAKHDSVMFLVVSDDPEWCRRELQGRAVCHCRLFIVADLSLTGIETTDHPYHQSQ